MKTVIIFLMLVCTSLAFSQEQSKKLNLDEFSMTINADSLSEIDEVNIEDIIIVFQEMEGYKLYSFEINCNFSNKEGDVEVSNISFKIESESQEKEAFLEQVKKSKSIIQKMYNLN